MSAAPPQPVGQTFARALALHQAGRLIEAERLYRQVCAADPRHAASFHRLGVLAHQLGRNDAADLIRRALTLEPQAAETHNDLGVVLAARGQFVDAAPAFARAAALKTDYVEAHANLGAVLMRLGRFGEAAGALERALAFDPNSIQAHDNLASALKQLGRREDALRHYQRVVALAPNFAGAHNNLANMLKELGRNDQALPHYDRAIALAPGFAGAHYNRGVALRGQSRFAEAFASFERAAEVAPDFIAAKFAACMARLPILYSDEVEIARRRADYAAALRSLCDEVARLPNPGDWADVVGAHQPFYLAYQGENDRALQMLYGALVSRIMGARFPPSALAASPAAGEPVRVGIVSGFFRDHSNWRIPIRGWLSQMDRRRFRLFGYHTGTEQDGETKVARNMCERFVQGPLPLEGWCAEISRDAPHVLIYPEIGMDPVCVQLAAQRLAPVQCASWGHPETSGLPTIDYFLSSELMEPRDPADHYSERLIKLPNLSVHYEPNVPQPVSIQRSDLGLRSTATVYWCSQAVSKYLPQFDQVFARIAREAGDCQFIFIQFPGAAHITEALRERLMKAFAAFGLNAAEHIVMLPRLDRQRYAAAAALCDIALDSIGWSGCNSTFESLAQNLPVVTMPGALMRGRHTAAILTMMDVTETVAVTLDDYVAAAVRLARDLQWRNAIKAKILANRERVYRDQACIAALEGFLDRVSRERTPA